MSEHPHKRQQRMRAARRAVFTAARGARRCGGELAVPVAAACAGLLAITSMINASGTDLRGGRHTDLIGLVSEQRSDVQDLQRSVAIAAAQRRRAGRVGARHQDQPGTPPDHQAAEAAASVCRCSGPGLVVTLDDAPHARAGIDGVDPNLLVVHQQDIQAVVNALWSGGAEGISIENQRIISTTGIKCVGNTVVAAADPLRPAVPDQGGRRPRRDSTQHCRRRRRCTAYVDYTQPPYEPRLRRPGDPSIRLPGYDGPLTLKFARAARLSECSASRSWPPSTSARRLTVGRPPVVGCGAGRVGRLGRCRRGLGRAEGDVDDDRGAVGLLARRSPGSWRDDLRPFGVGDDVRRHHLEAELAPVLLVASSFGLPDDARAPRSDRSSSRRRSMVPTGWVVPAAGSCSGHDVLRLRALGVLDRVDLEAEPFEGVWSPGAASSR